MKNFPSSKFTGKLNIPEITYLDSDAFILEKDREFTSYNPDIPELIYALKNGYDWIK